MFGLTRVTKRITNFQSSSIPGRENSKEFFQRVPREFQKNFQKVSIVSNRVAISSPQLVISDETAGMRRAQSVEIGWSSLFLVFFLCAPFKPPARVWSHDLSHRCDRPSSRLPDSLSSSVSSSTSNRRLKSTATKVQSAHGATRRVTLNAFIKRLPNALIFERSSACDLKQSIFRQFRSNSEFLS